MFICYMLKRDSKYLQWLKYFNPLIERVTGAPELQE